MARFSVLGALLVVITLLAGCSSGRDENYDLVIMSPHQEKIQNEFKAAFSDWFQAKHGRRPRIEFRDNQSGTSSQELFIADQFTKHPDGIGFDVFFGGGIEPHVNLAAKGLLAAYRIPNLDQVAPDVLGVPLYDPGFHYYGAALSGFGLVYNRAMFKQAGLAEPTSWLVLDSPELFAKVGAADPAQSGSALAAYETILQAYGWEKGMRILTLMAANARAFYPSASGVPENVGLRQVAVGCAIDFYAADQIEKSGPEEVGFCLPENLTVVTPDCISILKGAPHMEIAQEFVAFVMSEAGQKLWFLPVGAEGGPRFKALARMPVIPALYQRYQAQSLVKYDPFKFTKSFKYDSDLANRRRDIFRNLFMATLIRPQPELASAWATVLKVKDNAALIDELTRTSVSEKELLDLAGSSWSDPAARSTLMTEWTNGAVAKYKTVRAKAESAAGKN